MDDTTSEMKIMQRSLHNQLSEEEKWSRGFEMIENGRSAIIASLKLKFPFDTDTEIFIKMVNTLYKNDVSEEFLKGFERKAREHQHNFIYE